MLVDRIESTEDYARKAHYVTLHVSTEVTCDLTKIADTVGAMPLVRAALREDWRDTIEAFQDVIEGEGEALIEMGGEWACRDKQAREIIRGIENSMRKMREYWEAYDRGE